MFVFSICCFSITRCILCLGFFFIVGWVVAMLERKQQQRINTIAKVALLSVSSRSDAASMLTCSISRRAFFFMFSRCRSVWRRLASLRSRWWRRVGLGDASSIYRVWVWVCCVCGCCVLVKVSERLRKRERDDDCVGGFSEVVGHGRRSDVGERVCGGLPAKPYAITSKHTDLR